MTGATDTRHGWPTPPSYKVGQVLTLNTPEGPRTAVVRSVVATRRDQVPCPWDVIYLAFVHPDAEKAYHNDDYVDRYQRDGKEELRIVSHPMPTRRLYAEAVRSCTVPS